MKAQVAIEFFVYASVFLLLVIGAIAISTLSQVSEVSQKESYYVKEVGRSFSNAFAISYLGGEGFIYEYRFNPVILDKGYKIKVNGVTGKLSINYQGSYSNYTYQYDIPKINYPAVEVPISSGTLIFVNTEDEIEFYSGMVSYCEEYEEDSRCNK